MENTTRLFGLISFFLFTAALSACGSAADDGTLPSSEQTAADSQPLKSATTAAAATADKTADCEAQAAVSTSADDPAYQEYESILETSALSVDLGSGALGNTCTRVCACCKNGNRFCCSHCRFCSGPIGVSTGVLSP